MRIGIIGSGRIGSTIGGLDEAKRFDVGTLVYITGMSGPELRRALGLA